MPSTRHHRRFLVLRRLLALAFLLMFPGTARAGSILFTESGPGVDGVTLNASVLFDISGNTLTITLTNTGDTSGSGQDVPGNTLTGVFFDLPNQFSLTPVSATILPGTLLNANLCNPGPCSSSTTNVGGEFRYSTGAFPAGADRGIASAGYIGGPNGNFNGPNLDDPEAPNGVNFGIVAPGIFNPNGGMNEPLIQDGPVKFVMSIGGGTLTLDDLEHVSFQYGTDLNEPNIPGPPGNGGTVPEPASVILVATGLAITAGRFVMLRHGRRDR